MKDKILAAAKAAPPKLQLEDHREAVLHLREKGYSWREIAEFLTEHGIETDHTRVYRTFGKPPIRATVETREVEVSRVSYLGQRKTKKDNFWLEVEIEIATKLGQNLEFVGAIWSVSAPSLQLGEDDSISFRNARFSCKARKFPIPKITVELLAEDGSWSQQELWIAPKWDAIF